MAFQTLDLAVRAPWTIVHNRGMSIVVLDLRGRYLFTPTIHLGPRSILPDGGRRASFVRSFRHAGRDGFVIPPQLFDFLDQFSSCIC